MFNVPMLCCLIFWLITIGTLVPWELNPKLELSNMPQTSVMSPDDCVEIVERVRVKNETSERARLKEDLPFPAHRSEVSQLRGA